MTKILFENPIESISNMIHKKTTNKSLFMIIQIDFYKAGRNDHFELIKSHGCLLL